MNRFEYADSRLLPNETYVRRDMAVRLYDGDTKVKKKESVVAIHRRYLLRNIHRHLSHAAAREGREKCHTLARELVAAAAFC